MIKRFFYLLLVFMPFQVWATQAGDINTLQKLLAQHKTVRGEFTQLRHLDMFEQPLVSKGFFTLSKSHGVLWLQSSPFELSMVLTENKLHQTFAKQPPKIITAQESPMSFYFSRIFLAVFRGDFTGLKGQFDIDLLSKDGGWVLALIPRQAPLDAVFKRIVLEGEDYIDSLQLEELRGDKTEIRFTRQSAQPQDLTHAEKAQFSF